MGLRRSLSSLLATTLILTLLPISSFADNYNGTGSGNQGGNSSGVYTWSTQKQGYRLTIIDQSVNVVADPVDILQSKEPASGTFIYTSKVESFKSRKNANKVYYLADILKSSGFDKNKPMPMAIGWDSNNNAHGEGEALRKWLMAGEASIRVERPTTSGNNYVPPTNSGSSTGSGSSSNTGSGSNSNTGSNTQTQTSSEVTFRNSFIASCKKELDNQINSYNRYGYSQSEMRSGLWNYMLYQCERLNKYSHISSKTKTEIIIEIQQYTRQLQQEVKVMDIGIYSSGSSGRINLSLFDDLMPMIAYGAPEEKGYMIPLLNYSVNGEYIIKFNGKDNKKVTGQVRGQIIAENDYIVLIEPIAWFIPLDKNMGLYGKYVYGTITNHAQWAAEMNKVGWDDWGKGGYYSLVTTGTGATALKLSNNLVLGGKTIKVPNDGNKASRQNTLVANTSIGYALHSYKAEYGESGTRTFDHTVGNIPHKAPDPSNIPVQAGEDVSKRSINIVKTYEDDGNHVVTYNRNNNPQRIVIQDEIDYKVDEWFISKDYVNADESTTWTQIKSSVSSNSSGKSTATVKVEEPNTTLYVKLIKKTEEVGDADLVIRESQITKAIDTMNPNIPNWGSKTMNFEYQSLSGICNEKDYCSGCKKNKDGESTCPGHTCGKTFVINDKNFDYNFKNIEPIKAKLQADAGVFKALNTKGDDASGNRSNLNAGTDGVNSFNYQMVLWRGKDIPTLASYKENSNHELNTLLSRYGKQPTGTRTNERVYYDGLSTSLDMDSSKGDYITNSKCPEHSSKGLSSTAKNSNKLQYNGNVTIQSYNGVSHKIGNAATTNTDNIYAALIGKPVSVRFSGGTAAASSKAVKFYPYIRMTYQKPAASDNDRINVNVLSQWISELYPNSFAEAAWGSTKELNMNISSPQWSVHQKATQGLDGWQGTNQVLPGGSIYNLDTKNQNTYASVITWQPYIEGEIANKVLIEGGESYKLADTVAPHDNLAKTAEKALDNWRVVQYVEKNTKASSAFGGLKVTGGNVSLTSLGLQNKSSVDDKYYMKQADVGGLAGQGDVDIINKTVIEVHYKVKTDVEGNIIVYRKRDGSDWVEIERLNKNQGVEALSPEIKALDDRTQIITNLITVLTRNQGNDKTASWAPDGKWYNEAFDGICYVRKETSFEVGFLDSPIRSAALDPKLTPVNKGQSDLFSKAFISQFRMNDKSDVYTGETAGYVGKFKGQNVILNGAENMFKTRVFSIPNVTVQDLK